MLFFSRPAPPLPPLAALKASLLSVAARLRDGQNVVDLTPRRILRNAVFVLRSASPLARLLVDNLVPFAVLGFGICGLLREDASPTTCLKSLVPSFRAEIKVPTKHRLYTQLVGWIARQDAVASKRALTLDVSSPHLPGTDPDALVYLPLSRSLRLKFRGHWLTFHHDSPRVERRNDKEPREDLGNDVGDITISCFSWTGSTKIIKQLLQEELEDATKSKAEEWTSIYKVSAQGWGWASPTDEIREYQDLKEFYKRQGKPYRKGYLLYGPPGTGKTSLALALAGKLGLPLYILSIADRSLTDPLLEVLFEDLPSRSIVLMEDMDSAGIHRENMSKPRSSDKANKKSTKSKITLSGLLNAIDGPASAEGRILIMTTNARETLDKALIRDGRIDHEYEMGYATKEIAVYLFDRIYLDENKKPFKSIVPEGITQEDLDRLRVQFSAKIPDAALTTAEIQGFLMQHRKEPQRAVELVEEWCLKKLDDRASNNLTSSLVNDSDNSRDGGIPAQEEEAADSEAEEDLAIQERSFWRMMF
ncbi:putative mitochondrial chaperone BCS1-A [Pseudocercospora fuligena]|uniref:Putative mitochondrial chaperone BCS1-A n=1 Tax=Pseudocercospora fuligena TaxID=685502 RepID=A0A8H6RLM5_9PEZI|nr:putative mitochondrial chaperone BCS1-A [Pseudocercospora fuligena]